MYRKSVRFQRLLERVLGPDMFERVEVIMNDLQNHHEDIERLPDGKVRRAITRESIFSGKVRTMTFTATQEEWHAWDEGELVQKALWHLSDSQREFILTGATQEEWDSLKGEDDE